MAAVNDSFQETLPSTQGADSDETVFITKIVSAVVGAIVPLITEAIEKGIKNAMSEVVEKQAAEISNLNDELLNQAWKNDSNEQYTRRENIRIVNPPKGASEKDDDTNKTVIDLCEKMGVTITEADISTSHWLPGKSP